MYGTLNIPTAGFLQNSGVSEKNKKYNPFVVSVEISATATEGSLYEVLRVEPTATIKEIKTAYRSLAKVYHPDFSGNGRDFIEIHHAYETLSDPLARVVYDMSLVRTASCRFFGPARVLFDPDMGN